jgi:superfamily I DNA and RNA helicase
MGGDNHTAGGSGDQLGKAARLKHMDMDAFREKAPDMLMDAASLIHTPGSGAEDKLFDAIIVDEAQDFEDTWWIPLPELLRDPQDGVFYVFFDDNQRIYRITIPMDQEPFICGKLATPNTSTPRLPYAHPRKPRVWSRRPPGGSIPAEGRSALRIAARTETA